MSGPDIERLKDMVSAALQRSPEDRLAFLEETCGEDAALRDEALSLLAAHDRLGEFLETPAPAAALVPEHRPLKAGERVDEYEIVRVLGSGGTGTVYQAVQSRPRRHVALKVMRLGLLSPDHFQRFQNEAEILARLKHPGVAHVYDAGVHEQGGSTLPWFALEFVEDARTLLRHSEHAGLSTRARLELFVQIADAVHHGHQKGIIHRDLKPGNILIEPSGRPKIIDFGIARIADPQHLEGHDILGTPAYMSPEQCEPGREIDVRSDVYSLGVVLYELLCGSLPYETDGCPITEFARRIRETPAVRIGSRDRHLRGDLEAITQKALGKDPEDRYPSASGLAADIRRHLANRPVESRPPTLLYVIGRLARRRTAAFAALAAVVVISLAAAVVTGSFAWQKARAQRQAESHAYFANIAAAATAIRINDVGDARQRLDDAPAHLRSWEWHHLRGLLDTSSRTLRWPQRRIYAGAVSPEGDLLAAVAGRPSTLRIWSVENNRALHTTALRNAMTGAIAFSPDGRVLAVGYWDGAVELRDSRTGTTRRLLEGHTDLVDTLAFAPAGDLLASGSRDGTVRIWHRTGGEAPRALRGHSDRVIALSFDPSGKRLYSGGREGVIRVWDPVRRDPLAEVRAHESSVEGLAVGHKGEFLASVSRDETVRLWTTAGLQRQAIWRGHTANVRSVAFCADGSTIASASYDRTVRLWRIGATGEVNRLRGHTGPVMSVGCLPESGEVVSFSLDGTIKIWSASARNRTPVLRGHRDLVSAVAFGPGGMLLASASRDGSARIWDLASRQEIHLLSAGGSPFLALATAAAETRLLGLTADGVLRFWELPGGALLSQRLAARMVAAADRRFVIVSATHHVEIREFGESEPLAKWKPVAPPKVVAISSSGDRVAWSCADGTIELRDASRPGSPTEPGKQTPAAVTALGFAPDGRTLAAGARDGTTRILDAFTLEVRVRLDAHADGVRGLAFSPDGTRLATCASDGVRVWDPVTGHQVLLLPTEDQPARAVEWSPDGTRLAAACGSYEIPGMIFLWGAG